MDETIKQEEAKKKIILPMGENQEQPYNANREYQNRYSHRVYDRFWLGPRRY